jgi:hypothetical protein
LAVRVVVGLLDRTRSVIVGVPEMRRAEVSTGVW